MTQDSNILSRLFRNVPDMDEFQAEYQDEDIILVENSKLFVGYPAIRTNFNMFVLCNEGWLSVTINNKPLKLSPNVLLRCPTEAVVTNASLSDNFKYMALAISDRAMQSFMKGNIYIWNLLIYKYKMYTMEINESDLAILQKFYDLLRFCYNNEATKDSPVIKKVIVKGLIETSLNAFCFRMKPEVDKVDGEPSLHSLDLFNQFLSTLQQSDVKRRPVEQYASELCISAKYLSDICKKHSGKTAKQWIQEYTLADVVFYLRSTKLSIKEISSLMGFPNSSFFCKYVKEHLHCSPIEYRQDIKN